MAESIPTEILNKLTTFGELLRYLRRRAGLTQTKLSIAVGYSDAQISRLEQNLRLPNLATVQARFLPVLKLKNETLRQRFESAFLFGSVTKSCWYTAVAWQYREIPQNIGVSDRMRGQIRELLRGEFLAGATNLCLIGRPGTGKSHVMAALARALLEAGHPVLWFSSRRYLLNQGDMVGRVGIEPTTN
jgi:hypothetical protein